MRQLQINKAKAFTLIETMLALFIIQLLLFISISYLSTYHYIQSAHNNNVTLLINQFDFYKSKAL
nr:competence protein ComGD [Staphylococcus lugdunensis]